MKMLQTYRDCCALPRNSRSSKHPHYCVPSSLPHFINKLLAAVAILIVGPTLVKAGTYPAEYATLSAGVEQMLSSSDATTSSSGTLPAMLREQVINSSVLFDDKRAQQTKWNILTSSVHGGVSYIVADATSSYDAVADKYRRWVILLPQYGVLMLDEFQTSASNYRLRFNNDAKFRFDENPLDKHFESISLVAEFIVPDARGPVQVKVSNWPSLEPVTISQRQATGQQLWQLEVKSTLEQNYAHSQYIITWIEDHTHESSFRGVSSMWEKSKATFTIDNRRSGSSVGVSVDFGKMTVNRTK